MESTDERETTLHYGKNSPNDQTMLFSKQRAESVNSSLENAHGRSPNDATGKVVSSRKHLILWISRVAQAWPLSPTQSVK
jgi:hypothetical protein